MRFYISEAITLKLETLALQTFHGTICIRIDLYVQYLCYCSTDNGNADTLTFISALLYTYMKLELPYAA